MADTGVGLSYGREQMAQKLPDWCGVELEGTYPDGWTPYEICIVTKSMDAEGVTRLGYITSKGWSEWELAGALNALALDLNIDLHKFMSSDPDQPDE